MPNNNFLTTKEMMKKAVSEGVFPSASILVAKNGETIFQGNFGNCADKTIFDVASLTKPVITATLSMIAISKNHLDLNETLERFFPGAENLKEVKVYNLLNHSSGLPGWRPYYQEVPHEDVATLSGREQIIGKILNEPLEYKTGEKSVYSDLGYILLAVILEKVFSKTLISLTEELIVKPLGLKNTFFRIVDKTPWSDENFIPAYELKEKDSSSYDFAPTQDCPWRQKVMNGYVDDQNCYCMGGVSGHSGLFSTVDDLHLFLTEFISSLKGEDYYFKTETVKRFAEPYTSTMEFHHPGTYLLGWDRPAHYNSQAGRMFSKDSIGHLGYTGCSMWIDLEKDIWIILLTNRVHPSTTNEKIKYFRPQLHDQIIMEGI